MEAHESTKEGQMSEISMSADIFFFLAHVPF